LNFGSKLTSGRLRRRYKRFLADIRLDNGDEITAHCPNTGAMLGCDRPGSRVWLSRSDNPRRKYAWTWELVEPEPGVLVGINTMRTNSIVREAIGSGLIPELRDYPSVRSEVTLPGHRSRFDFLLEAAGRRPLVLEVKNVTAAISQGRALFPDARSERATRHVTELQSLVANRYRSMLLFCVQREDVSRVAPFDEVDPDYAEALRRAAGHGVMVQAWACKVDPVEVRLVQQLSVDLDSACL